MTPTTALGIAAAFLPLVAALAAAALRWGPAVSRQVVRLTAVASACGWVAALLLDDEGVGAVAAAGAGSALLLALVERPVGRRPLIAGTLPFAAVSVGLAVGDQGSLRPVAVALAVAVVAALVPARYEADGALRAVAVAGAGVAALGIGLVRLHDSTGAFAVPDGPVPLATGTLVVGGAALVVAAAGARVGRAGGVWLPPALLVAVPIAARLSEEEVWGDLTRAGAVALAVGAAALLATTRTPWWRADPVTGVALWSVAAAAAPGTTEPSAWLLGAAAVLLAVVGPAGAAAAAPGAVALAGALLASGEAAAVPVAVLAALTTGAVVRRILGGPAVAPIVEEAYGLRVVAWPAAALATWLVVAPGSWGWAGAADLADYTRPLVIAAVAALVTIGVAVVAGVVAAPGPPVLGGVAPAGGTDGSRAMPAALAGAALAALAAASVLAGWG